MDMLGIEAESLGDFIVRTSSQNIDEDVTVAFNTLHATADLDNLSTGSIDNPRFYISWRPQQSTKAANLHFLGFQCSEFALPVRANDTRLQFDFFSRPKFVRPHSVFPLIVMDKTTDHCVMLAPVDSFHEQVLAIRTGDNAELRWGWSGDLGTAQDGFQTTLAIISGTSPRRLLHTWGKLVRSWAKQKPTGVNTRGRYADVSTAKLSLWTDNGASYWYRTEKGYDLPSTLEATISDLNYQNVPVTSVELDSWFYSHEITRKVTDVGYLDVVPPTGMMRWEPREDVLGEGGIAGLRDRVGKRPLILHSRHISSKSDYLTNKSLSGETWWVDKDRAHPVGPSLFRTWMQQAADWGATTYEQDWLVEVWQGVRQLREKPGRIARWQQQLNDAARERNVNLIWCMATPADMAQAVSLQQIVAIRSCDDYRYAKDASILWRWHLTTSCLISSIGLWPFKDVFMSHGNGLDVVDIDGDPNSMLEACLSALSAGPVGIGDRMGRTVPQVVRTTCRSDGVLVKPDFPLAALDRSLRDPTSLLWAETQCGPWRYIIAIRTGIKSSPEPSDYAPLTQTHHIASEHPVLVYNWKTRTAQVAEEVSASLRIHEWVLWVVCPIFVPEGATSGFSLIGDPNLFATMGDRRFRLHNNQTSTSEISFDVLGVHGEDVSICFWSEARGVEIGQTTISSKGWNYASLVANTAEGLNFQCN